MMRRKLGSLFSTSFLVFNNIYRRANPSRLSLGHETNPSFDINLSGIGSKKSQCPLRIRSPFPSEWFFQGSNCHHQDTSGGSSWILRARCVFFVKKNPELPVYEHVDRHQHHLVGPWLAMRFKKSVNCLGTGGLRS